MKVRELQQRLGKLDPDLEVLCYSEDEVLQRDGQVFRLFDIETINTTYGEKVRLSDNVPYLKLGRGPNAENLVIITVTSEF